MFEFVRSAGVVAAGAFLLACGAPLGPVAPNAHDVPAKPESVSAVSAVSAVHGGAGPWVMAGYRMGTFALEQLGAHRYSWDLEVVHASPKEVQYSCIADGAAAATGASLGKLNLRMDDAARDAVATTYRLKSTGRSITLRTTQEFERRFKDVPRSRLGAEGEVVANLPNEAIFEIVKQP